jgi:hypothetical protein
MVLLVRVSLYMLSLSCCTTRVIHTQCLRHLAKSIRERRRDARAFSQQLSADAVQLFQRQRRSWTNDATKRRPPEPSQTKRPYFIVRVLDSVSLLGTPNMLITASRVSPSFRCSKVSWEVWAVACKAVRTDRKMPQVPDFRTEVFILLSPSSVNPVRNSVGCARTGADCGSAFIGSYRCAADARGTVGSRAALAHGGTTEGNTQPSPWPR